jgi:hypothetical protein
MDLEEAILLDYTAPESDPFAHYLIVEVDTSKAVSISETLDGVNHIIFTDDGRGRFTVDSGQTIHIVLSNPNRAVGTVNTTFYCESWNYAAYTLTGIGIIIFVLWYFRSDDEYNEEL